MPMFHCFSVGVVLSPGFLRVVPAGQSVTFFPMAPRRRIKNFADLVSLVAHASLLPRLGPRASIGNYHPGHPGERAPAGGSPVCCGLASTGRGCSSSALPQRSGRECHRLAGTGQFRHAVGRKLAPCHSPRSTGTPEIPWPTGHVRTCRPTCSAYGR